MNALRYIVGSVSRTVKQFNKISSVKDLPRPCRPVTESTKANQLNVALLITENRHSTIRKLQQKHNLSFGSVH